MIVTGIGTKADIGTGDTIGNYDIGKSKCATDGQGGGAGAGKSDSVSTSEVAGRGKDIVPTPGTR